MRDCLVKTQHHSFYFHRVDTAQFRQKVFKQKILLSFVSMPLSQCFSCRRLCQTKWWRGRGASVSQVDILHFDQQAYPPPRHLPNPPYTYLYLIESELWTAVLYKSIFNLQWGPGVYLTLCFGLLTVYLSFLMAVEMLWHLKAVWVIMLMAQ